jgi:hypothetical protein
VEKLWRYGKINGIFREKQRKTLVPMHGGEVLEIYEI